MRMKDGPARPGFEILISGHWRGFLRAAAISRATPQCDNTSGRLGVTSTSSTLSPNIRRVWTSCPTAVSAGRTRMPEWSSAMRSSLREHSIPDDSSPRSVAFSMTRPPGSVAPILARGTICPAATLGAPQTIWSVSCPSKTEQTESLSAFGCLETVSTRAVTTFCTGPPQGVMEATSNPRFRRRTDSSSGERSKGTNSLSQ